MTKPWVEAQNVHMKEAQAACDAYNEAKFGKQEKPNRRQQPKPSERAFLRRKTRQPSATHPTKEQLSADARREKWRQRREEAAA